MKIGLPKEIKNNENRVGLTPIGVKTLIRSGHELFVETQAGAGVGFTDADYQTAGATVVETAAEAWSQEMVIKVKEPLPAEYPFFREDLLLFTYLHLANEPELTEALLQAKTTGVAYETVQLPDRSLPLLAPMSEVAGRMASQIGAQFLEKVHGGKGILLGGVPGVDRGKVTIVGGGVAGTNAAKVAIGLGADVTIMDISPKRLREIDMEFGNLIKTKISNEATIEEEVRNSDLVIGAVLIPGAKAPKLVKEYMVEQMKPGSVLVDIAIDQGGIFETTDRITTHEAPTFEKHGVVHYSVANMPGAVPRTSALALENATLPFALELANKGYKQALRDNPALMLGLNTEQGYVTFEGVAEAFGKEYVKPELLID
ncbi:alanine dehydrogenase [Vagococcus coleopterorum]|uniref:Alanine dehydrogenase n=1 Tax=Vagococcus coleopterorum TaxID=2714946 RepID=A0A6G8ANJ7_9ENTE|nr:alanine dehydrogenase [Vagococcus coleopterorum]QIL46651.1 alanine dehydrogenase [Vagococcus coleopterorum]